MKAESSEQHRLTLELVAPLEAATRTAVAVHSLAAFGDGHSGFTYSAVLESGGEAHRRVIRLSPPGVKIAGPADVGRQGRIMGALFDAGLPVPEVIACDSAPVVDGRSFAVLELVDGVGWEVAAAAHSPRRVAEEAAAFLQRLHGLVPEQTGIGDEAGLSPADEIQRWSRLLPHGVADARGPGEELSKQLLAATPDPGNPVLVHGDFHWGNMLFGPDGELVAVLDWEIAARGYRLLDFGCLAAATLRRRYAPEPNPTGSLAVSLAELAEVNEVEREEGAWAIAAACFKYGAIIAYNLELHRQGKRPDPVYEQLQGTMLGLLRDGTELLRVSGLEPLGAIA